MSPVQRCDLPILQNKSVQLPSPEGGDKSLVKTLYAGEQKLSARIGENFPVGQQAGLLKLGCSLRAPPRLVGERIKPI